MKIDGLTGNDLMVLLVLASEGREMSTAELKEVGPAPTTDVRNRLEERGLIVVDRTVRPFRHSIDDDGWDVLATLVTEPPKVVSNPAARTLWTVLQAFGRHMERTEVGVADVLPPAAPASARPASVLPTSGVDDIPPVDPTSAVRAAYHRTVGAPGGAVWLSELRTATALVDSEFDAVIVTLSRERDVEVLPEENRKAIPGHARAGAVTIGGQPAHYLRIRGV